MKLYKILIVILFIPQLFSSQCNAQSETLDEKKALEISQIVKSLTYHSGWTKIADNSIEIKPTRGFKWLSANDSDLLLHKLWNNPSDKNILCVLVPDGFQPFDDHAWAITLSYADEGYISDQDASKIDYTDLMKLMKKSVLDSNPDRKKNGYPPIELVGWATSPYYDKNTHKLFWAKEIKFGDQTSNTLNYNFRVLGRKGVLVMNAIADMGDFNLVKESTPEVLSMADFTEGNRYTDYNKDIDKTAEYGIAGLIAGAALVKTGLLKGIWMAILASYKLIIALCVAIAAFLKKIWNKITGAK